MRIQKYFSQKGILSRRETEKEILAGNVTVNETVTRDLATQIDPEHDTIKLNSERTVQTILYYKPRGLVCTKGDTEGKTVFDALPQFRTLHTVGRLDKESEGLLLLTNDGVLSQAVTSPKHLVEKEYEVHTEERVTNSNINALSKIMMLTDGPTLQSKAKKISEHAFRIALKEGRNHQVRRMADKVGLSVLRLIRIRIGTVTDSQLKEGDWRPLTDTETAALKKYSQ